MLTLQDCLDYVDLSEEEIDAIACHEHVPIVVASELGNYLVESEEGVPAIKRIILDDIDRAERAGNVQRVDALKGVLMHFIATHPSSSSNAS